MTTDFCLQLLFTMVFFRKMKKNLAKPFRFWKWKHISKFWNLFWKWKVVFGKVNFFYSRGSMMNVLDLQRVRADQAASCLVIADKFCDDPDGEDASNIMRVISLKNFCEETRVIIQLMQYHNKSLLLNIPGKYFWSENPWT